MKRVVPASVLFLAVLIFAATAAQAKDLANRVGLGYSGEISTNFVNDPGIGFSALNGASVKYWINKDMGIQVVLGMNTWREKDKGKYDVAGEAKYLYNLIQEENMNFFVDGAFGAMGVGVDTGKDAHNYAGFTLGAGGGFEWFFSGLPNLGFSAELGLKYTNVDRFSGFGSYGGAFTAFGIHYYF